MPRDRDQDSGVYTLVFAIAVALFLFVAYQVYQRYLRPPAPRPVREQPARPGQGPEAEDDGYDRAPSSLPPVRVDGGVMGG